MPHLRRAVHVLRCRDAAGAPIGSTLGPLARLGFCHEAGLSILAVFMAPPHHHGRSERACLADVADLRRNELCVTGRLDRENIVVAGIPAVATVGVFNLAHFRAAGVLAEAEGVSFEQADAEISARTGRAIETAAGYTQTRGVATEILSAHPLLVAKQVVKGSLFQLLDPGFIYFAQITGASPRGSGCSPPLPHRVPQPCSVTLKRWRSFRRFFLCTASCLRDSST